MFRDDGKFSLFMNRLGDILYVGLLWLLASLPLVTAGAAATAGYYAMAKCVRHRTGYIWREFWHSFKSNFRQMLPLNLLFLGAAAVLAVDMVYLWGNDSRLNSALFMLLLLVAFLLLGLALYACPLLSRFEKKNLELIRMAAVVMFRFLPVTVGLMLFTGLMILAVYLMPWAVFVLPGLYLYVISYPMERILRKLMPKVEKDSEEAQKWYYKD